MMCRIVCGLTLVVAIQDVGHQIVYSRRWPSDSVFIGGMYAVMCRIVCGLTLVVAIQDVGHQIVYLLVVCMM